MGFNVDADTQGAIIPRGQSFPECPPIKHPLKWNNTFGYMTMLSVVNGMEKATGGINERGLSISGLWRDDTEYASLESASTESPALYNIDLVSWVLGNFDNITSLQEALASVTVISSTNLDPCLNVLLHYIAIDRAGNSLIIEYKNGRLKTY